MAAPKKYGLTIMKGKSQAAKRQLPQKSSVFGEESSDEELDTKVKLKAAINRSLVQESQKKATNMQAKVTMAKALEQDPTVYQYDEVYDAMEQTKKAATASKKSVDRKPKYIHSLLKNAAARKLEDEQRQERQAHREREKEGEEFEDKDAFITPAYKRKMEELRAAEEEARRREAEEAANDVTRQNDLSKFYRNLLARNVSKGGRFTQQTAEETTATSGEASKNEPTQASGSQSQEKVAKQSAETPKEPSRKSLDGKDHKPVAEDKREESPSPSASSSSEEEDKEEEVGKEVEDEPLPGPERPSLKRTAQEHLEAPGAKHARRNDETSVLSARERYLQRRQQQLAAKGSAAS